EGVDTLILGCTHFPLLAPIIGQVMGENVTLIDSGLATARYAVSVLENTGLLNPQTVPGKQDYFVSDRAEAFCDIAGRFLGRDIPAVTKVVLE
ncbi:MAG: aspartate/glutamate racemase family protein, partial [Clostridia bacterium]|nr:aspartate/glutamate racemase family protein [Clostridia bacterium]